MTTATEIAKKQIRTQTLQVLDHIMQSIRSGDYEPVKLYQGTDWETQEKDKKTQQFVPTGYMTLELTLKDANVKRYAQPTVHGEDDRS